MAQSYTNKLTACMVFSQVAIKLVCKKKAPQEYLTKFMPREIDSLNATCRHHNVVGDIATQEKVQFISFKIVYRHL